MMSLMPWVMLYRRRWCVFGTVSMFVGIWCWRPDWGRLGCCDVEVILFARTPEVAALRWNVRRVSWEGGEGWVGISWSLPVSRCWVSLFLDLDYLRRKMGRPWCPFSRWDPECDLILLCCHTTLAAVFCYWAEIEKMELDVETWFPSFHGS
jgi:hypothetical protein